MLNYTNLQKNWLLGKFMWTKVATLFLQEIKNFRVIAVFPKIMIILTNLAILNSRQALIFP